ncbi:MAG: LysR substrate-binding domain-containing protein [Methylobacterium sp.]
MIIDRIEELRTELSALSLGVRGRVQISANASAVEQFLPDDMRAFSKTHPEIRIELRQGTSREVALDVLSGEAELGVCGSSEHVAALECRPYRVERLVLVTPCDHPLSQQQHIAFRDTLDFEQIGMRGSSSVRAHTNNVARALRRAILCRVEVDSLSAMCRMIECNIGIGIMPMGALQSLNRPQLRAIRLTDSWAEQTLNLYALNLASLSAPAQHLMDLLGSRIE